MRVPTIRDVAEMAGVSTATVSRVLNDHPRVSPKTRAKVLAVLERTRYVPNMNVVALTQKRTDMVALVVPDITNPFFTTLVRGFEDKAHEANYTVVIGNTDEDPEKESRYIQSLSRRRVDGVALIPTDSRVHRSVELLRAQGIPLTFIDRRVESIDDIDVIRGDSKSGARTLVDHLIALGHRRIAAVPGPSRISTSEDRLAGYCESLRAAGIPVESKYIRRCEYKRSAGAEAMRELLATDPRPSAVFAGNNFIALGCIEAIREAGLEVPRDLALVCFDDLDPVNVIEPFLTVVAQPSYQMGSLAAETLIRRIELGAAGSEEPAREITLSPRLIVRLSCGAAAKEVSRGM